jgi:hypothetical protein
MTHSGSCSAAGRCPGEPGTLSSTDRSGSLAILPFAERTAAVKPAIEPSSSAVVFLASLDERREFRECHPSAGLVVGSRRPAR